MKSFGLLTVSSLAMLVSLPSTASAQVAPTPPQTDATADAAAKAAPTTSVATPNNDDIVVTANRTESLASKTPIALTAISGDNLVKAGITNTSQLGQQVPNINFSSPNGATLVTIRGITNQDSTEKSDPSAAFLIDNIYIARPQEIEVGLYDINRVEVLRGPQGTLFGRNTTAGAVNVLTNRPDFHLGGQADATFGNYDTYVVSGAANLPFSDTFAIRASIDYDQRGTYFDKGPAFTSQISPFRQNMSTRLQGLYRWTDGSILIRGDYSHLGGHPFDYLPLNSFYTTVPTGVDATYKGGSTSALLTNNAPVTFQSRRDNNLYAVSAELSQEVGPFTATYIGAYRDFTRFDADPRINAAGTAAYRLTYTGNFDEQTHELRFATKGSGPFKGQFGGFYFLEHVTSDLLLNTTPNSFYNGVISRSTSSPVKNQSYAAFGQATYALVPSLRLTIGARYTHDLKELRNGGVYTCTTFDCSGGQTQTIKNDASVTFQRVTWKAGLDFDLTPATLAYATVSTGYKAGGFNNGCAIGNGPACVFAPSALYYAPETLTSYEGGLKGRILNGLFRYDLDVFHYDYANIQLSQLVSDCGGGSTCTVTTNGGKAKVTGVELESTLNAGPNDRFSIAGTYLDAHFTDFRPTPAFNFAGRPLSKSPKWTALLGYRHVFQLANGGNVEAGVRSKLSAAYYLLQVGTANYYPQPSYTQTDLTLTYNAPNKHYYVQGFARNLENVIPVTTVLVGTRSSVEVEAPRTFGGRIGVRF